MQLTRVSPLTDQEHTRDIPLSPEEFDEAFAKYSAGALIQDAFPTLSADDREFVLTGITPEEWNEYMGSDDEDAA